MFTKILTTNDSIQTLMDAAQASSTGRSKVGSYLREGTASTVPSLFALFMVPDYEEQEIRIYSISFEIVFFTIPY